MNRILMIALWIQIAVASLWAQNQVSSIKIYVDPPGARFYVDGQLYYSAQVFLWPAGSKHVLQFPTDTLPGGTTTCQTSLDGNYQYCFGGWQESTGNLIPTSDPVQVVTADPAITWFKANVTASAHVMVRFSNFPTGLGVGCGAPGDAPQDFVRVGVAWVAGACYQGNADLFLPMGSAIPINAMPYPGFVFTGWTINGTVQPPYLSSTTVVGPLVIYPQFTTGTRVKFVTAPPYGLRVLVDGQPVLTSATNISNLSPPAGDAAVCTPDVTRLPPAAPATIAPLCYGEFDFIPGSKHVLAVQDPQYDVHGKLWVFDSFSNGLGQNAVYTASSNTATKDIIEAKFLPGVSTSIITNPGGLKVSVDGRDNWGSYNFVWAAGSSHSISAPDVQTDSKGRKWVFKSWSNAGAASQTITVPDDGSTGFAVTAVFQELPRATVTSAPTGLTLSVDGSDCVTPCVLDRAAGAVVQVVPPATIAVSDTERLNFSAWSDGASRNRSLTFNVDTQSVTADYTSAYKLSASSDPAAAATFTFTPSSSDMFYDAGAQVTVLVNANGGYKFRRWSGDLSGTFLSGVLTMSSPHSVMALLDKVPFIPPAGIRNAAGDTPDGTVAPGSIMTIFGDNLAGGLVIGTTNPLPQTLGDVIVEVEGQLLPLLFVSPTQINAQVPSNLSEGQHQLTVQWTGQPDVNGTFTVARNSPGLFPQVTDHGNFVVAMRPDGTMITESNPAHKGETITVYGTGFGPYDTPVIDGFLVPDSTHATLVDPVTANAGGVQLTPVWTGAATGMVGTTLMQLKITDDLPSSSTVPLQVTVNGKMSNTVLLPVQ